MTGNYVYWPHFPEYRARAGTREIPVVVLEPVGR
jgi:F420H(2)-dependent quinone reductase